MAHAATAGEGATTGGPGPCPYERRKEMDPHMDERQRRARELDALEIVAEELGKQRILKEHELGVRLEHPPEGAPP
jgi:hypothetical protein